MTEQRVVRCLFLKCLKIIRTSTEYRHRQYIQNIYVNSGKKCLCTFYFRQTGFSRSILTTFYVIYPQSPFLMCLQSFSLFSRMEYMYASVFSKKIFWFCFVIHNVAIFSYVEYIYLLKIIKCGKKGHFQFWFHGYKTGIVCCFFLLSFSFLV